jgi:hypothetical protein
VPAAAAEALVQLAARQSRWWRWEEQRGRMVAEARERAVAQHCERAQQLAGFVASEVRSDPTVTSQYS